ncbi:MAG: hypothetical protein JOZ99_10720 [Actinobacteria bacterium]|nr:hypothetical protein [Actinomycetota bacterium]
MSPVTPAAAQLPRVVVCALLDELELELDDEDDDVAEPELDELEPELPLYVLHAGEEVIGAVVVVVVVEPVDAEVPLDATAAADFVAVAALVDVLSAIAVPRPRNALVLSTATTRRARQAGERRFGRVPGPAGRRGDPLRSFGQRSEPVFDMRRCCACGLGPSCVEPETLRRPGTARARVRSLRRLHR